MPFSYLIIEWYGQNKRDLPWRHTNDPYMIWVSEVILQQTRVEQGLAYYHRFVERFPDIDSLASADEEEVMKLWQGLGYYSRARNMHQSAITLRKDNQAKFPASYDEIIKMKGVGDYSASAIASIVYGEPHPVVDGNVLRVMARYEGITEPVNSTLARKKIKSILENYIDKNQPGIFNQAVMELGAMVCKPKQPLCTACPLQQQCFAFRHQRITEFPVVSKAKPPRARFFHYLVIISESGGQKYTWLKKRSGSDIWKNLYDFPLVETKDALSVDELLQEEQWKAIFKKYRPQPDRQTLSMRHILSHQELRVVFIQVHTEKFGHDSLIKTRLEDIHKYPVPRLIENYLKKIGW